MKQWFVQDVAGLESGAKLQLKGWIKSRRNVNGMTFLDVTDSTGTVQVVIDRKALGKDESAYAPLRPEASIAVDGVKRSRRGAAHEVEATDFRVIGEATLRLTPRPRMWKNMFLHNHADHMLRHRHFYLRNERQAAVLRFKSMFLLEVHRYLQECGCVFIDAPVLTQLLLYDDSTAFRVDYRDNGNRHHDVFLSQCCTFQLEAAVHAFEKVYNVTPSFRAEHSKSNRHLREYWHLKVELAWVDLDELVAEAERLLCTVISRTVERAGRELALLGQPIDLQEFTPPFRSVTYDEAVDILHRAGKSFTWGKSLGTADEELLTRECGDRLLWVRGIPRSAEAFPFKVDPANPKLTRACDLIAPQGFAEILGVAEKITTRRELLERMAEKGRGGANDLRRYGWYLDMRDYGIVPHGGIGMGVERAVRYLLKLPHIRYTTSFPRLMGRTPNP